KPAFAGCQGLLCPLPLGDQIAEDNDSIDFGLLVSPGMDFPAQPVHRPIRSREAIFVAYFHRALQTTLVNLLPTLRQVWKHIVMTAPDEILVGETIIRDPSSTER